MFWAFIILTHPGVLQELDFIIYTRGGGSWSFRPRSRGGLANFTVIAGMGHLICEPKFKIPTPLPPANFSQVPNIVECDLTAEPREIPPRPHSLFLEHGSGAKTLNSRSCRQDVENLRSCQQDLENSKSCGKIWKIHDLATHHSLTRCSNSRRITHQLAGKFRGFE